MLVMVVAMLLAAGVQSDTGVAASTPATPVQPDAIDRALQQAMGEMQAGHNAEALALLDPMADAVAHAISKEKAPVFCAHSKAEALVYMARANPASPTVRLIRPSLCSVLFVRAYVLENLHRLPEALDQLRQLIALEPDFPHYQVEYGAALRQAGDMPAALAAYRRAVEIAAPTKDYALDQATALRGIGFILTEQGDLDGAEQAYRQSLELAPGHPVALNELAYIAHLRATGTKAPAQTLESNIDPTKASIPNQMPPK